ncbi:MAG: hypothetical protein M0Z92_00325 [Actinomycetota bacterium]|nr:hypothetical protein [Actinomycetota bacterium]
MEPAKAKTYRERVREVADYRGYVTTAAARAAGIPARVLGDLTRFPGLAHVARGVYKLTTGDVDPEYPEYDHGDPTRDDMAWEAVLAVGEGAYITGAAALYVYDLAYVLPDHTLVGLPYRLRRAVPPRIEVIQEKIPAEDITTFHGIPIMTAYRALWEARAECRDDYLLQGCDDALEWGLITPEQHADLKQRILDWWDEFYYGDGTAAAQTHERLARRRANYEAQRKAPRMEWHRKVYRKGQVVDVYFPDW